MTEHGVTAAADQTPDQTSARRGGRIRHVAARTLRIVGLGLLALLLVAVVLAVWPVSLSGLSTSHAAPATSYDEALATFDDWAADEDDLGVLPQCRSELHTTGEATEVSVVLFHGLTNCPVQFKGIADELTAQGMNVVVLRAPDHGIAADDGVTIGSAANDNDLTAEDLATWADASVDIAEGLGDEVRVLGLSMGGVAASWVAQHRETDRVVAVAPAMALHKFPAFLDTGLVNLATKLPHFSVGGSGTLDHAYPGTSISGAAQMFRLATAVRRDAQSEPPLTTQLVVITNPDDDQVDNDDIDALADDWAAHGATVHQEVLDVGVKLPHDVVDADQPTGATDLTWPILVETLTAGSLDDLP